MTHPPTTTHAHPDARIDHVLNALRTAEAPSGLEARIASRIAHANEAQTSSASFFAATPARATTSPFAATASHAAPSFFAVILNAVKDPRIFFADAMPYALPATALILLLAIVSIAVHNHQAPPTAAQSAIPNKLYTPTQQATLTQAIAPPNAHARQLTALANTPPPQGFSLGSLIPPKTAEPSTPPPTDPDAIALAETLAPSHPAPPEPLTQQELLMLAATRPGQPLEIAELEPFREPALRAAAEAHQHATRRQYLQGLLAPLVFAQALEPTSPSPSQDEPQPATPSESPSSK